jgi:phage terminase small subunit
MPGRPKKPLLLHNLHGTARKSRMEKRAGEMQLESATPDPPEWLLPEARAEWDRLIANSKYKLALATVDRAMMAAYCQLWAKFVDAELSGKEFGGRQLMSLIQIAAKLGLNPQDRTKIKTAAPPEKADNPWAALG